MLAPRWRFRSKGRSQPGGLAPSGEGETPGSASPRAPGNTRPGVINGRRRDSLRLDIVRFHTVASTVVRTVVPLNTSGNEDGRSRGFNNLGQLAFRASFTDGSAGIFVADLTPTTPTLL